MMRIIILIMLTLFVTSCVTEHKALKSPCVGTKGSPCDRQPINEGVV